MLIYLIADYMRHESLRQRFANNPREVLEEYGISEEQQKQIRSRDLAGIHDTVTDEARLLLQGGSQAGRHSVALWGSVDIRVVDVAPGSATTSTWTPIKVTGWNFPRSGNIVLNFDRSNGPAIVSTRIQDVTTGPSGLSTLTASVVLTEPGDYTVIVANSTHTSIGTWSGTLTVTKGS